MKNSLTLQNIRITVGDKTIVSDLNLEIQPGKVHALMGANGSGKSTLANGLMGNPNYHLNKGKIILNGKNITELAPDKRAHLGLFLSFQYPPEIGGVTVANFLRASWQAVHKKKITALDFYKTLEEKMAMLHLDESFAAKHFNQGFSGGEKKKMEMLQMLVLEPKYAILDETDSGLDVDALKIIGKCIKYLTTKKQMGVLIITHYNRFLHHIVPDKVHILSHGEIVKSGTKALAKEVEKKGFKHIKK